MMITNNFIMNKTHGFPAALFNDFYPNISHLFSGPRRFNISRNYSFNPFNSLLNIDEETEADIDVACVSMDPNDEPLMMSHKVYLFSSFLFVFIGLIGNALSIMVFSSKVMRIVSCNVYLLFLAISDSLYLLSVFLTKILTTLRCLYFVDAAFDLMNRHSFVCKMLQYMLDLFSDYSTCLILAFTVERYIACYHPIKFKEICTLKRARIACASIFIFAAATIAPYHFMFMGHPKGYDVCTVLPEKEAEFTILYVVEAMLFRVVPVILIAVLNIFIIVKVIKMNRAKMRRTSTKRESRRQRSLKEDKHRQLTIMLILVSTSYIIAYLPVLVHFVMWKLTRSYLITVSESALDIMHNYAKPMYIFGFAINFFLYTMSGRVFRDQLILMVCRKKMLRCNERMTENTGLQQQPLTTMNGKADEEKEVEEDNKNGEAATLV